MASATDLAAALDACCGPSNNAMVPKTLLTEAARVLREVASPTPGGLTCSECGTKTSDVWRDEVGAFHCWPCARKPLAEMESLRSELASLRHALDECRAGMREADKDRAWWRAKALSVAAECDDAEHIASLAMSEGLRAVERAERGLVREFDMHEDAKKRARDIVLAARSLSLMLDGGAFPHECNNTRDELRAALAAWEEG